LTLFDKQRGSATERFSRSGRLPEEPARVVWIKRQTEEDVSDHQSQEAHAQKGEKEQGDAGLSPIFKQVVTLILHGLTPELA
jgi:hypothetical protein